MPRPDTHPAPLSAPLPRRLRDLAGGLVRGTPLTSACYRINDTLFECPGGLPSERRIYPATAHYDRVEALCRHFLPGWGWRTCQCHLSTDAWLFPDWNDPAHADRLMAEFPPAIWEDRAPDLDIRPPIGSAEALLACLLETLARIEERKAAA